MVNQQYKYYILLPILFIYFHIFFYLQMNIKILMNKMDSEIVLQLIENHKLFILVFGFFAFITKLGFLCNRT